MMKRIISIINIILILAICIGDYYYINVGGLSIKSITSSLFALLGLINTVYATRVSKKHIKYSISMCIGLFLAMLGDIFLEIEFIFGAVLFALGHIGFLTSYIFIQKIKKNDILCSVAIFISVALFILFSPLVTFNETVMKWVCIVYALVISLMGGKAIMNYLRNKDLTNGIIAVGSILFIISDFMLLLDLFVGLWSWTGLVCLVTYYPAEALLASSIFIKTNKN